MRSTIVFIAMVGALLAASCANMNTAFREFDVEENQSIAIDAKQRVVLSVERAPSVSNPTGSTVVCAEPSPDALSAFGAQVTGGIRQSNKAVADIAATYAETSSSIGVRTQTIQLLRDSMYRICEGYLSEALDNVEFARLHRAYQNNMLALLAVEQLTGVVSPANVELSSVSSAQRLSDFQTLLDAQRTRVTELQAELDQAKSESGSSSADEIAALEQSVADATENVAFLEEVRTEILQGSFVRASAQSEGGGQRTMGYSDAAVKYIADAVQAIVREAVNKDYTEAECLRILTKADAYATYYTQQDVVDFCINKLSESAVAASEIRTDLPGILSANSEFVTTDEIDATPILLNQQVALTLNEFDLVWYSFQVTQAGRFAIVANVVDAESDVDPFLELYGPGPVGDDEPDITALPLLAVDDDGGDELSSSILLELPTPGTYYFRVINIGLDGELSVGVSPTFPTGP